MSVERDVYVQNGVITLVTENDGATFLRRGAERTEEVVTLKDLKGSPRLYEQAKAELIKQGFPVD